MADRAKELQAAVAAVRAAAHVCREVQANLVTADTLEKKDKSPVTVADFASQAIVCSLLERALPNDAVVGEEDAADLRPDDQAQLRAAVHAPCHQAARRRRLRRRGPRLDRPRWRTRHRRPLLDARPHRRYQGLPAQPAVRDRARPDRKRRGRARCARLPEPRSAWRARRAVHGDSRPRGAADLAQRAGVGHRRRHKRRRHHRDRAGEVLRIGRVRPLRPQRVGRDRVPPGHHQRAIPHRQPVQVRRCRAQRLPRSTCGSRPAPTTARKSGITRPASWSSNARAAGSPMSTATTSTSAAAARWRTTAA